MASNAAVFRFRSPFERRVFVAVSLLAAALAVLAAFVSPYAIFAIILSLAAVAVSLTRPYLMAVALAVWTPFEPFLLKFVPDELYVYARYFPELMIYVLAALVAAHCLWDRRRLPSTPIDFAFVLLLVSMVASAVLNLTPVGVAALGARQILRYIILYFAVVYLAPPARRMRQTVIIMLGIAVLEALLGLAQAVFQGSLDSFLLPSARKYFESIQLTAGTQAFWAPGQRVFATLGRYDQLGTFLNFFALIALGLAYEARERLAGRKLLVFFAAVLPALLLTYSRASWFGFLLGFLVIGLWIKRDRRVAAGLMLFVSVVAGIYFYERVVLRYLIDVPQQTIAERFYEAFSPERFRGEYYGLGRVYWWVTTPTTVVASSPFFGVGPGNFGGGAAAALRNSDAYDRLGLPFGIYGTEGQIDSNWMSLWGELGTVGLIFYLAILFILARQALRVFRRSSDPWSRGIALGFLGAEAAVVFQALLGSYLEVRTLAFYLWIMAAFVTVTAKREEIA
jgi:hypothetical protein